MAMTMTLNGRHRKKIRGLFAAALLLLSASSVSAQSNDRADANANIVFGISIVNTAALRFGQILSPLAAGTVTITTTPNSQAWSQGGTLPTIGGTVQPAAFTISKVGVGGGSPKFWIETPSTLTLLRSGGGASMTVNAFNANVSPNCQTTSGGTAAGPQGQCATADGYNLLVGGTLNVTASQQSGSYAGTFAVTVHRY